MAHEYKTSSEEVSIWIVISIENATWLSISSSHNSGFKSDAGIM